MALTDILERLRAYNPPDRVLGKKQSQIATDIAEAAAEIGFLRREVERWQTLASQGITIEADLRKDALFLEREIERLKLIVTIDEKRRHNAHAAGGGVDSVECPHCHWGFHPSVIDQHIREKH